MKQGLRKVSNVVSH